MIFKVWLGNYYLRDVARPELKEQHWYKTKALVKQIRNQYKISNKEIGETIVKVLEKEVDD